MHPRLSSTAVQYSRETTVQMSAVHRDRPLLPPPPPLSLPAGTQTVSSRLKYFCRAPLRLCPTQLMHRLIQHNNTLGGLLLLGLLMSYRYSLLPPRLTMHPLPFHQIFSTCRLLLTLRRASKMNSGLLRSEEIIKMGKKESLID